MKKREKSLRCSGLGNVFMMLVCAMVILVVTSPHALADASRLEAAVRTIHQDLTRLGIELAGVGMAAAAIAFFVAGRMTGMAILGGIFIGEVILFGGPSLQAMLSSAFGFGG